MSGYCFEGDIKSTLSRNVTIKGGVVMRSITNNIRRATQDMSAILKRVKFVFRDKIYKDRVDKSDKRWLDTEIDEVFDGIVEYLNTFK